MQRSKLTVPQARERGIMSGAEVTQAYSGKPCPTNTHSPVSGSRKKPSMQTQCPIPIHGACVLFAVHATHWSGEYLSRIVPFMHGTQTVYPLYVAV